MATEMYSGCDVTRNIPFNKHSLHTSPYDKLDYWVSDMRKRAMVSVKRDTFTWHNYYLVTLVIQFFKLDTICFPRICNVSLTIVPALCRNEGNLSTIVVVWEVSSYVLYCLCLYIRKYSYSLCRDGAEKMATHAFNLQVMSWNLC